MTRVELPDLGRWAPQRTDAQRWEPPRKLTVVVAPHPDDETLLSGGLIAHQARAGVPVIVLAVTDGEAAYPGDPDGLARQRRREQRQALRAPFSACTHRLLTKTAPTPGPRTSRTNR